MNKIAIIGAGPTGATLALRLAQAGIEVKLIEAAKNFQRQFRGEGLMPSGLEALEQMDLSEILERVPQRPIDSWEIIVNERSLFQIQEPFEPSKPPCTLVSQPHLLTEIVNKASQYPNLEFLPGSAVKELVQNQAGRVVGVKLASGQEITADLVIGADGRNSIVRKQAGLKLTKLSSEIDILWFKLSPDQLLESENTFYSIVRDRSSFGLFRSSTGELNLGWALHQDDDYDWKTTDWRQKLADTTPEWLAKHIRAETTTITAPLLLSVVVGRCPQWYKPGVLLLGDAAHPMSPIRAQGINMALQDALFASKQLITLWQDQADTSIIDKILAQIQSTREPAIIKIQKLQQTEFAQAQKLRRFAILRSLVSNFAPLVGLVVRGSWFKRQLKMR